MLHVPQFLATRRPAPPAVGDWPMPALTPSAYLRLRRKAWNLTIDDVADLLARNGGDQAEARSLIAMLEKDGVTARGRDTLELVATVLPIDVDVYFQLATEPTDRHPSICRGCGCSQHDACGVDGVKTCSWAARDICTFCSNGERY